MKTHERGYWLIKQEPETYSWDQLVRDGQTDWTGVRNFQARNNLRSMRPRDQVLYYHTGKEKAVVGVAEVVNDPYPESTGDKGEWTAVDVRPIKRLDSGVTLAEIRGDKRLSEVALLRQSRLSVVRLKKEEFDLILELSRNKSKR